MAEFGAGLDNAEDGVAADDADDVGAVVGRTADDWHLIDVGGEEALEQALERFVLRGPEDAVARNHYALHGIVFPLVARDGVQGLDIH